MWNLSLNMMNNCSTRAKLAEYFADSQKLECSLKIEFAPIADAGKSFVQATYKLEGDSPIVFQCYEIISALSTTAVMDIILMFKL